jgi:hypothetical protein
MILTTIDQVGEELQPKIDKYQEEAVEVLAAHFLPKLQQPTYSSGGPAKPRISKSGPHDSRIVSALVEAIMSRDESKNLELVLEAIKKDISSQARILMQEGKGGKEAYHVIHYYFCNEKKLGSRREWQMADFEAAAEFFSEKFGVRPEALDQALMQIRKRQSEYIRSIMQAGVQLEIETERREEPIHTTRSALRRSLSKTTIEIEED